MPFLRVVRDKRGYETTYLIHSVRDGSPQASRVLYAFRSPGGIRVGRDPFEPDVRREIEARNPGIVFDWDALVSGQQLIDAAPEPRRPRRRPSGEAPTPPAPVRPEAAPPTPRLVVPAAIEGDTPEMQMRFLAHWHGILCEHLPQRISDAERREGLMLLTERLNPAGWVDADEIAAGLQKAGEALEQLSRVLAKRRRKNRRGGRDQQPRDVSPAAPAAPDQFEEDVNTAGRGSVEEASESAVNPMTPADGASDEPDSA